MDARARDPDNESWAGTSLLASRGADITREIAAQVLAGKLKPVVGRVAKFEEIPEAIASMANRETTGRTIAMLALRTGDSARGIRRLRRRVASV